MRIAGGGAETHEAEAPGGGLRSGEGGAEWRWWHGAASATALFWPVSTTARPFSRKTRLRERYPVYLTRIGLAPCP